MTDLYQEEIIDLFKNPLHQGEIADPDFVGDETNSSCGDSVKVFLKVDKAGKVIDMKWQGTGCVVSQTGMSVLSDYILSKKLTLAEIKKIKLSDLVKLLKLEQISPGREKCLGVGLRAMQNPQSKIKNPQ